MHLRKLEEKDADGMLEWMHDPQIQKYFCAAMENKTKDDVLEFIHTAEITPKHGKSIHYAITDEEDSYLGTISLKNMDMISKSAEYAISLRKSAQRKGIASKATKELLKLAFEKFYFQRIYLNVLSNNRRAIQLYEKSGFVYEGTFRRHLFIRGEYRTLIWYSILDYEYFRRNQCENKKG